MQNRAITNMRNKLLNFPILFIVVIFYNGFNNAEQISKRFIGWDAQRCS